jgi:rhomboid protease GluP
MFVHASIAHIAFNLFALAYLGVYAERAVGVPRYILVYLTSGTVAALFHGAIASYILHNGNVVDRCVRCNFWRFRDSCCNR